MPVYFIIAIISLFYLFLWVNHLFINTEKKWYKILVNTLKYILLVPFWLLVLIISVNLFLPLGLSNGLENDMVYIKNAEKEARELLFIGKVNKLGEWFVIHPIKESKLKTVFELQNTGNADSINIDFPYDSIAALNTEVLIPGKFAVCHVFPLSDTIQVKEDDNIVIEKSAINTEFEYTQAGLYLLVIFGIWFHVVSAKEKESKGKFTAGAAVATILCIYIIYHYIKTIVLLS